MNKQVRYFVHRRRFGRKKIDARLDWRVVATFAAVVGVAAFVGLRLNESEYACPGSPAHIDAHNSQDPRQARRE